MLIYFFKPLSIRNFQNNLLKYFRNYEEQISTMSDHLADLNEKLTAQSEAIEHFKFEAKVSSQFLDNFITHSC